jgi:hypothetical protein
VPLASPGTETTNVAGQLRVLIAVEDAEQGLEAQRSAAKMYVATDAGRIRTPRSPRPPTHRRSRRHRPPQLALAGQRRIPMRSSLSCQLPRLWNSCPAEKSLYL